MLKLAMSLAVVLALTSPSLAKTPAAAPAATHICQSPDALKEKFIDATVVDDLSGAPLVAFNAAYAAATKQEAPPIETLDRMVVFASKDDPDNETYLVLFSKNDCVFAAQPLSKKAFRAFRHPGDGI